MERMKIEMHVRNVTLLDGNQRKVRKVRRSKGCCQQKSLGIFLSNHVYKDYLCHPRLQNI